jgi:hypothetical protein
MLDFIEFAVFAICMLGLVFFIAARARSGLAREMQTTAEKSQPSRGARTEFYERLYAALWRETQSSR